MNKMNQKSTYIGKSITKDNKFNEILIENGLNTVNNSNDKTIREQNRIIFQPLSERDVVTKTIEHFFNLADFLCVFQGSKTSFKRNQLAAKRKLSFDASELFEGERWGEMCINSLLTFFGSILS